MSAVLRYRSVKKLKDLIAASFYILFYILVRTPTKKLV